MTGTAVDPPAAAAVACWLRDQGVAVVEPLHFDPIAGGRSNLTYLVGDAAGERWVLRRPPLSTLADSAHDVGREYRVMKALHGTPVPVPGMVAFCDDPAVVGARFYVMRYVDGIVLERRSTAERSLTSAARAVAGESMVDLLGQLHAVVPAEVGLAELGRGTDYLARQLRVWGRQVDQLDDDHGPELAELAGRLQAAPPAQLEVTIVHGDFRPGNIMVGPDGPVRALLDWELSTLGDPLADLGWLLAYWGWDEEVARTLDVPTLAEGFPSAGVVLRRYLDETGRSGDEVDYYVAFALWRLAVVLAGVRTRNRRGAYGAVTPAHLAELDQRVAAVVAAAARATGKAGR
jgi:aminoglycoside phosphotransferase (APT) family kinase protein